MSRLRTLAPATRLLLAAVLALAMGVWLAMPAGFMPALANGSVAIVPCPAADEFVTAPDQTAAAMAGMAMQHSEHGHDGAAALHHPCPYAAAASLLAIGTAGPAVPSFAPLPVSPAPVTALESFTPRLLRERPPSQGPPLSL